MQRIEKLLNEFQTIIGTLVRIFGPIPFRLPQAVEVSSLATLKRYEDAIDALLCAWVGICYLEGKAIAFGDETSSICVPIRHASAARRLRIVSESLDKPLSKLCTHS